MTQVGSEFLFHTSAYQKISWSKGFDATTFLVTLAEHIVSFGANWGISHVITSDLAPPFFNFFVFSFVFSSWPSSATLGEGQGVLCHHTTHQDRWSFHRALRAGEVWQRLSLPTLQWSLYRMPPNDNHLPWIETPGRIIVAMGFNSYLTAQNQQVVVFYLPRRFQSGINWQKWGKWAVRLNFLASKTFFA